MSNRIVLETSAYSSHFEELLKTDARYVIAYGGRGSGKTYHIVIKLLLKSFEPQYNHIIIVNKEKVNIRKQQYLTFKLVAKQLGLFDFFTFYNGDCTIVNNETGTMFSPIGMDDSEKTKGITDPTIIWWDEINKGTREDFTTLNTLLRTPKNKHQFIISFNPVSEKHWLRDFFFDADNAYKLNNDFKNVSYLNHSTYRNNEFINQKEYYNNLVLSARGNPNRLAVDADGVWGVDEIKAQAVINYNPAKHLQPTEYREGVPLIFSIDFNRDPLVCLVAQIYRIGLDHYINVLNEIIIKNGTTSDLIKFLRTNYTPQQLATAQFTGDATGRSATTQARLTNWQQLESELNIGKRLKVPRTNPNVLASIELLNYVFYNHKNIKIDPLCRTLDYELQYTEADERGLIKKDRTDAAQRADALDCLRYLINTYCLIEHDIYKNPKFFGINI